MCGVFPLISFGSSFSRFILLSLFKDIRAMGEC